MGYAGLREKDLDNVSKVASELTQQNLRDFEERLSSQVASKRREKIVFSDKEKHIRDNEKEETKEEAEKEENLEEQEGDGEGDVENPNEAENEQQENDEQMSIKSKSEIKSMSRASRKSYVLSLRQQLLEERDERKKLEEKVKELIESKKGTNSVLNAE